IASGHDLSPAHASATKVFGTEFAIEAYRALMEGLGPDAPARAGSPGALLRGRIERMHRSALILTFGGGTNEVQRDIVAAIGLGLPPAKRERGDGAGPPPACEHRSPCEGRSPGRH